NRLVGQFAAETDSVSYPVAIHTAPMSGGGNRTPSLHEDTQATIDGAAQLGQVVLGRAERSSVALVGRQLRIAVNDPYISTSHARLLRCVNGWAIEDL